MIFRHDPLTSRASSANASRMLVEQAADDDDFLGEA
jgi:hypothetical protein